MMTWVLNLLKTSVMEKFFLRLPNLLTFREIIFIWEHLVPFTPQEGGVRPISFYIISLPLVWICFNFQNLITGPVSSGS